MHSKKTQLLLCVLFGLLVWSLVYTNSHNKSITLRIPLEQAVIVLNENSDFRVNLELLDAWSSPVVEVSVREHIPGKIHRLTQNNLFHIASQIPQYDLIRSGDTFTLIPKSKKEEQV